MKKNKLKKMIEPFIYDKLTKEEYEIKTIKAIDLLSWNRLDLAFKLFYLDNKRTNFELAKKVYKEDIKSQTSGKFIEYGNENKKNNFEEYLIIFDKIFKSIKSNGFDKDRTLIPLSKEGTLINGSHRISSSIFLDKTVDCIVSEESLMITDFKYFFNRNVSLNILDLVVNKFIEYSNHNTHIAFLWPSGKGEKNKVESFFSNIVYKKEIRLYPNGAFNLLIELYKHMDWVGSKENGFRGAKQKLIECFPSFESFTVLVFQSESIEAVREIKEKVRQVYEIGFSSIHITDTKEEAIRISKLIFNENGIHFLNYAKPHRYNILSNKLDEFQEFLRSNNCSTDDIVLDGSTVLSQYGLRKNDDIDYLIFDNNNIQIKNSNYDTHDSQLKYHKQIKEDLIYNPKYFFQFNNLKFVSFNQTYLMKKNRNEDKDITDCGLMNSLIENNNYKKFVLKQKQSFFYFKIKLMRNFNYFKFMILRKSGLYKPVRFIYKKITK
jgi:hypothetical protein